MADVTVQTHVDTFMRSATASAARDALGIQSGATYSTVAEMVAADVTNITSGQTVALTGYYAAGDFGEPINLIVEASTGGVKSHTLADGRYANLYAKGPLDVRWFGAKGDNTTDDSAAIQAAITAAETSSLYAEVGTTYTDDAVPHGLWSDFYTDGFGNASGTRTDSTLKKRYEVIIPQGQYLLSGQLTIGERVRVILQDAVLNCGVANTITLNKTGAELVSKGINSAIVYNVGTGFAVLMDGSATSGSPYPRYMRLDDLYIHIAATETSSGLFQTHGAVKVLFAINWHINNIQIHGPREHGFLDAGQYNETCGIYVSEASFIGGINYRRITNCYAGICLEDENAGGGSVGNAWNGIHINGNDGQGEIYKNRFGIYAVGHTTAYETGLTIEDGILENNTQAIQLIGEMQGVTIKGNYFEFNDNTFGGAYGDMLGSGVVVDRNSNPLSADQIAQGYPDFRHDIALGTSASQATDDIRMVVIRDNVFRSFGNTRYGAFVDIYQGTNILYEGNYGEEQTSSHPDDPCGILVRGTSDVATTYVKGLTIRDNYMANSVAKFVGQAIPWSYDYDFIRRWSDGNAYREVNGVKVWEVDQDGTHRFPVDNYDTHTSTGAQLTSERNTITQVLTSAPTGSHLVRLPDKADVSTGWKMCLFLGYENSGLHQVSLLQKSGEDAVINGATNPLIELAYGTIYTLTFLGDIGSVGHWSLTATPSLMFSHKHTITSAEVLALNTTAQKIVPRPGAGMNIVVNSIQWGMVYNSAAYVSTGALRFRYEIGGNQVVTDIPNTDVQSGVDIERLLYPVTSVVTPKTDRGIEAYVLSADPTTGDSDMQVIVNYQIIPSLI